MFDNLQEQLKDGILIKKLIYITLIILVFIYFVTDSNNTAGWFQAIGSIAAIIAAALIAVYQSERNLAQAKQLKQQEKETEIKNLLDVIEYIYELFERINNDKSPKISENPSFASSVETPPNGKITQETCIKLMEPLEKRNITIEEYKQRLSNIGKLFFYLHDIKRCLITVRAFPMSRYPNKICIEYAFNYYRFISQFLQEVEKALEITISDEFANEYVLRSDVIFCKFQDTFLTPRQDNKVIIGFFFEQMTPHYTILSAELKKYLTENHN